MQIGRDQLVEPLLFFEWNKLLNESVTIRVFNILKDLAPKCSLANGIEAFLEANELVFVRAHKLRAETLEVAEHIFIDDTYQTEQL